MGFEELTPDDWIQIVIYGGFALYLSLSIPKLFRGSFLSGMAALLLWTVMLAGLALVYSYRVEMIGAGQRIMAVLFPGTAIETAPKEVTVFRRMDGQFLVTASVAATKITFVLDTGASTVVLRSEDAARLKLPVKTLAYDIPVSTANGRALTAAVVLPQLQIGVIIERDVAALVARPGALRENLLGMSFLNKLESFTFSNDRLIMRGQ